MRDADSSWASPPYVMWGCSRSAAAARPAGAVEILGHRVIWSRRRGGRPGRGAAPARAGPLDLGGPPRSLPDPGRRRHHGELDDLHLGVNNGRSSETSLGYFVNPWSRC